MPEQLPSPLSHGLPAIVGCLDRGPSFFNPLRASLVAKGMICIPGYRQILLTVALFDAFMRRAMS